MVPGANAGTSDTPFRLTFPYFELKRWYSGEWVKMCSGLILLENTLVYASIYKINRESASLQLKASSVLEAISYEGNAMLINRC